MSKPWPQLKARLKLRNRIADVIDRHRIVWKQIGADIDSRDLANAVLAELNLIREWGIAEKNEPEPGLLDFDRTKILAKMRDGDTLMCRWITDWTPDK